MRNGKERRCGINEEENIELIRLAYTIKESDMARLEVALDRLALKRDWMEVESKCRERAMMRRTQGPWQIRAI